MNDSGVLDRSAINGFVKRFGLEAYFEGTVNRICDGIDKSLEGKEVS